MMDEEEVFDGDLTDDEEEGDEEDEEEDSF